MDKMQAAAKFVEIWDGSGLAAALITDYSCELTCPEAEALADLFRAFGAVDTADAIIEDHASTDEPGDEHYTESEH